MLRLLILVAAVLVAMAAPAGASPIIVSQPPNAPEAARTNFAPNSLATFPEGDFLSLYAAIRNPSTPDPISSLSVQATQGSLTVPLTFASTYGLVLEGGNAPYTAFIPFAGVPTGSWTITATDSTGTSEPALTPAIANPQLLPFVTNITVSDTSAAPTVSWSLPDLTGFDVDRTILYIQDGTTEHFLFGWDLTTATTSFAVPRGFLVPGRSYLYAVELEDSHSGTFAGHTENSSFAFSGVTRVPEPAILMLLLAALAGIGGARLFPNPCR
jgi:hypothetical protein